MNMDMPQRLQTFPADSYDVPLDQLIVRYGDGPAMSTVYHGGPPRRQTAVDLADTLKKQYGLEKLTVSDNGRVLEIGTMVVPRELRSQGIGTKVMNELSRYADANNLQIRLNTAVPSDGFGTTSQQRLVDFYKRFGFVENKGRNKDFEISHGMYRNQNPSEAEAGNLYDYMSRE
jgi:GNAT superfamily N-acetyltransferase